MAVPAAPLAHIMIVIVWDVPAGQLDYVDLGPQLIPAPGRSLGPEATPHPATRGLGVQVTIQHMGLDSRVTLPPQAPT